MSLIPCYPLVLEIRWPIPTKRASAGDGFTTIANKFHVSQALDFVFYLTPTKWEIACAQRRGLDSANMCRRARLSSYEAHVDTSFGEDGPGICVETAFTRSWHRSFFEML